MRPFAWAKHCRAKTINVSFGPWLRLKRVFNSNTWSKLPLWTQWLENLHSSFSKPQKNYELRYAIPLQTPSAAGLGCANGRATMRFICLFHDTWVHGKTLLSFFFFLSLPLSLCLSLSLSLFLSFFPFPQKLRNTISSAYICLKNE